MVIFSQILEIGGAGVELFSNKPTQVESELQKYCSLISPPSTSSKGKPLDNLQIMDLF